MIGISLFLFLIHFANAGEDQLDIKASIDKLHLAIIAQVPQLYADYEKFQAQDRQNQIAQGQFDTTLRARHMERVESKYSNSIFDVSIQQQTKVQGISLYAGRRQGLGDFPVYDEKFVTSSQGEIYGGLILPILRNRSIDPFRFEARAAKLNTDIARNDLLAKSIDILNRGTKLYWSWIAIQREREVFEELLKIAKERQSFLEKRYQAGDVKKILLTDNLRSVNKRKTDLLKVKTKSVEIENEFKIFVGDDKYQQLSAVVAKALTNEFQQPQITFESRFDWLQLPLFQILSIDRTLLEERLSLARNQRLPELAFNLEGAREMGMARGQDQPSDLRVGVMLSFPLQNNQARGQVQQVKHLMTANQESYRWLEMQFEQRYQQLKQSFELNSSLLQTTKEQVENTIKMTRAERKLFEQGASNIFTLNIREEDEADARIEMIRAGLSLQILSTEYEALLGKWIPLLQKQFAL